MDPRLALAAASPTPDSTPLAAGLHSLRAALMKTVLRRILSEWARLDVPPDMLADDADLYAAGLSAIGTVQLMLSI